MSDALALLFLLGALSWLWYSDRRAHEQVLAISASVCNQLGVQRLDDSVALSTLRPRWSPSGPKMQRLYRFEFTEASDDRRGGEITLLGEDVLQIRVEDRHGAYVYLPPS